MYLLEYFILFIDLHSIFKGTLVFLTWIFTERTAHVILAYKTDPPWNRASSPKTRHGTETVDPWINITHHCWRTSRERKRKRRPPSSTRNEGGRDSWNSQSILYLLILMLCVRSLSVHLSDHLWNTQKFDEHARVRR